MFHLCRRGREKLRLQAKQSFTMKAEATGRRYVYQALNKFDKNHGENDLPSDSRGRDVYMKFLEVLNVHSRQLSCSYPNYIQIKIPCGKIQKKRNIFENKTLCAIATRLAAKILLVP